MKSIPLSGGRWQAIVDDVDYDDVSQFVWSGQDLPGGVRACRAVPSTVKRQHRVYLHQHVMRLMTGQPIPEGMVIDHINHDPTDNRRCNLRLCKHGENIQNQIRHKPTSSGLKWSHLVKRTGKWTSRVMVGGVYRILGTYDTRDEAHAVGWAFARKAHGQFACKG